MDQTEVYAKEYESAGEPPKDDEKAKKVIADARKRLKACVDNEESERAKQLDDLRFCTLDQWPSQIRIERENDPENGPRPCLTIDKINQYIVQVVNDIRQGRPGIVVRAQDDKADPETAKILKGVIRNIEDQSNAEVAYSCAEESAARIGVGYWRVNAEYVSEDSFDQDLFIRPIANAFSVYLGEHYMPDGSDARHAFVLEAMPLEVFKQKYPKAKHQAEDFGDIDKDQVGHWRTDATITVVEYFCLQREDAELYFLADGTTMYKDEYDKWPANDPLVGPPPAITSKRPSYREQLNWYKMTGAEILKQSKRPGKFIPIVKVVGREAFVDGKKVCWGLVRPAKDSLRMYNYFASTVTEKMGLAPKAPFIGAKGQFEGVEDKWKKANRINFAYLEYEPMEVNGNAVPPPQRQGPTPMEAALLNQMGVIEHDVQTSLGIFKAGLGEHESQQSGKAIMALQRESDTGTYHFGANLGLSIRHTGRILLDLIPHYYDTRRIVRILGDDGTVTTAQIDPDQDEARRETAYGEVYNPTLGKYDVTITVGPGYNTKRMEAASVLTEMVKSQPETIQFFGDIMFRSLDFPYADVIAERMRKFFPTMQAEDEQQMKQQLEQMQQQLQAAEQTMAAMQEELQKAQSGENVKMAELDLKRQSDEAEIALREWKQREEARLAREKAEAEILLKKWIAEQEHELAQSQAAEEQVLKEDQQRHDQEMDERETQAKEEQAEASGKSS